MKVQWQELKSNGIVQEVNRRLLHARGLALTYYTVKEQKRVAPIFLYEEDIEKLSLLIAFMRATIKASAEEQSSWLTLLDALDRRIKEALEELDEGWLYVQRTDDSEGWFFGDLDEEDAAKAQRFEALLLPERRPAFGFEVEPLPESE